MNATLVWTLLGVADVVWMYALYRVGRKHGNRLRMCKSAAGAALLIGTVAALPILIVLDHFAYSPAVIVQTALVVLAVYLGSVTSYFADSGKPSTSDNATVPALDRADPVAPAPADSVAVRVPRYCPRCRGVGEETKRCASCGGAGESRCTLYYFEKGWFRNSTSKCEGGRVTLSVSGLGTTDEGVCYWCNGRGFIRCVSCAGSGRSTEQCSKCGGTGEL